MLVSLPLPLQMALGEQQMAKSQEQDAGKAARPLMKMRRR